MKREPKSARVTVLDNSDPIVAETEAIQSRIRQRAFELSQSRPQDAHELYDWSAAEAEVVSVPPAELVERNGFFDLKFAVAGVDPDDLNIMVTPSQILLKSEFTHQHNAVAGTVHLCDFKSTTVFRSVDMPQPIDVKTVKVDFEDGIVHVTASKEAPAEAPAEPRPKRQAAPRKAAAKKSRSPKQP